MERASVAGARRIAGRFCSPYSETIRALVRRLRRAARADLDSCPVFGGRDRNSALEVPSRGERDGRRRSGSAAPARRRSCQDAPPAIRAGSPQSLCRPRHVLAACVEPDGPVDADGNQALVIDDARHPAFLPGGEAARPWEAATGARERRPRRRRCSWPRLVAPLSHDPDVAWRINGLAAKDGIEPSGP